MKIIVVLHNIRSCYNVGAILRTAEGLGVEQVILSGYTPRIHDENLLPHLREKLDREIHKTALGGEELVDIYSSGDIFMDLQKWKSQRWQIIGLENNIQRKPLLKLNESKLANKLEENVVLVLGEEVDGINDRLCNLIDLFVEIPMVGQKESFNVSVAAGIAMWGLLNSG